jgi:hypothetical protein
MHNELTSMCITNLFRRCVQTVRRTEWLEANRKFGNYKQYKMGNFPDPMLEKKSPFDKEASMKARGNASTCGNIATATQPAQALHDLREPDLAPIIAEAKPEPLIQRVPITRRRATSVGLAPGFTAKHSPMGSAAEGVLPSSTTAAACLRAEPAVDWPIQVSRRRHFIGA